MHRLFSCAAASLCLSAVAATTVSAAPITINFAGGFSFNDFEYLREPRDSQREDWAFDDAIRSTGAVTTPPGQLVFGRLFLALTFDTDVADVDPSPDFGHFPCAGTGKLWLGDTVLSFGGNVGTARGGGISFGVGTPSGPTLSAGGFLFDLTALYLQVLGAPLASDALTLATFANAMSWQTGTFIISFNGGVHQLVAGAQAVSVTVPEASSLVTLAGALLILMASTVVAGRSRYSIGTLAASDLSGTNGTLKVGLTKEG